MNEMKKEIVHYQSSHGEDESYEIEIHLAYSRPLTANDKRAIHKSTDEILKALHVETCKVSPEKLEAGKKNREELLACFKDSGIDTIYVEEIPNGYCGDQCCPHLPWLVVTTPFGHVRIGWRKRVIQIDWVATIIPELAKHLFPKEEVTMEGKMIHAWGYEKCRQYLQRLAVRGAEIKGART